MSGIVNISCLMYEVLFGLIGAPGRAMSSWMILEWPMLEAPLAARAASCSGASSATSEALAGRCFGKYSGRDSSTRYLWMFFGFLGCFSSSSISIL